MNQHFVMNAPVIHLPGGPWTIVIRRVSAASMAVTWGPLNSRNLSGLPLMYLMAWLASLCDVPIGGFESLFDCCIRQGRDREKINNNDGRLRH